MSAAATLLLHFSPETGSPSSSEQGERASPLDINLTKPGSPSPQPPSSAHLLQCKFSASENWEILLLQFCRNRFFLFRSSGPSQGASEKSGILWTWEALSELHWVWCNGKGSHLELRHQTPVKLSAPFDPSTLGIWEHAPRKEPRRKQNQERV